MPTVKDKITGDVVSQQPYTSEGTQRAKQIADTDPNWELSYAPSGKQDARAMKEQMYAGGGKTGYNQICAQPMYKEGGEVKRKYGPPTKKDKQTLPNKPKWEKHPITGEMIKAKPEISKGPHRAPKPKNKWDKISDIKKLKKKK